MTIFGHNRPLEFVEVAAMWTFQGVNPECFGYPFPPFFRLGHLPGTDE